jgi:hypothetical protein
MIHFDPETHTFSENGQQIPSVTTILKAGGWIDTTYYTEEGRRRGELVHKATALLDACLLDFSSFSEEIISYVLNYEKAREELKLDIRHSEHIVHKGRLWAGIEDREARWQGQLAVVELKTGEPTLADKLQVAAYGLTHEKPPRLLLLYLKPNGYKFIELPPTEREEFSLAWDRIVSLYHWRARWDGKR